MFLVLLLVFYIQVSTELDIFQALNHPFIVCLKYSFQSSKYAFLVLDLIEGGTFDNAILKRMIETFKGAFGCGVKN